MDSPTVVCLKRKGGVVVQGCDVYIGRRITMGGWNLSDSIWANPYKVGKDGNLDQVIASYREYVLNNNFLISQLHTLSGKSLGCWCKGKKGREKCHGDVLVELFNRYFFCNQ